VHSIPSVFINGEPYPGALDLARLREAVAGKLRRVTPSAH
jgi:protein-disulfide isomerase